MKIRAIILIVGLLIVGAGLYAHQGRATQRAKQSTSQPNAVESHSTALTPTTACKCYCKGESYSPGATACMGGFKMRCVDRGNQGTHCGWDNAKQGNDNIRCDGGEHCK